jgi:hypothetical protein
VSLNPKARPPAADEGERHHNKLLKAIADALGLVHGEVRQLRQTLTENGVNLQGARYLALPANVPTSGRSVLATSAVEVLGWVLTETSGTGPRLVMIEDGDTAGSDDGCSFPVSVLASSTNAARWQHGISFARGLAVRWPVSAGNLNAGAGTLAGVVLIR